MSKALMATVVELVGVRLGLHGGPYVLAHIRRRLWGNAVKAPALIAAPLTLAFWPFGLFVGRMQRIVRGMAGTVARRIGLVVASRQRRAA